ncbi:hypothetical protein Tco_0356117 [Tanacetum coccineum]
MALSIADQIALDDALVAPADRLRIGKCNLRLSSDVTSKEATLQVVYDVLKITPFYKAFQVTADAPETIWGKRGISGAYSYVHNRSVRFKMYNKKNIIGLGTSGTFFKFAPVIPERMTLNVNKLHQPWRSFAAVINKCLSGTPSYDSLRLSQAQILWGMYNKKNVDYAYLLWEDFIFKIENKSTKKGSAMYYPRFTKLVVNYVMEKDPSIPRRNKVALTTRTSAIRTYKEYYAYGSGKFLTKTKGSKKKANTDAIPKLKPPTAPKEKKSGKGKQKTTELENISEADLTEAEQLKIVTKRSRQETHSSHAKDDISWKSSDDDQKDDEQAEDDEDDEQADDEDDDEHDDDKKAQDDDDEELTESDNDGDDFVHPKLTTHDDEIIHEEDTDEDDS